MRMKSACPTQAVKTHSLSWNPAGTLFACGGNENTVTIMKFDVNLGVTRDQVYSEAVDQVAWHPRDNDVLCSTGIDGTVRLWDVRLPASKQPVSKISLKGENYNLAWSPDGHCIAVGNKDDLVSWIDVRTLNTHRMEQFKNEVNEFSWDPEGKAFFMTFGNGFINVFNYPELKLECSKRASPVNNISLAFDPQGQYFAVGSLDACATIWDSREIICLRTINRLEFPLRTLGFSFDGNLLACGSEDSFIDISDVETGDQVAQLNTQAAGTLVLAWHPKMHCLVFSCEEKGVRLFGIDKEH